MLELELRLLLTFRGGASFLAELLWHGVNMK